MCSVDGGVGMSEIDWNLRHWSGVRLPPTGQIGRYRHLPEFNTLWNVVSIRLPDIVKILGHL